MCAYNSICALVLSTWNILVHEHWLHVVRCSVVMLEIGDRNKIHL